MDKESLEKLLDGKSKEIRTKAILLFNGTATCAQAYQAEPSSVNRRNWEDSDAALKKFVAEIASVDASEEDKPLQNLFAVLEYLQAGDWRVTKTSLYRHQKEGKISPGRDGFYTLRAVDLYARRWLKQKSTGKKMAEKAEELQTRKLQNDIDIQEETKKKIKRENDKAEGLLIPRETVEIELAGRAGVLDAGIKHTIQAYSAEWIRTAGGDTNKVADLIVQMTHRFDELMNSYASPLSYQVVIDAEDDATGETPDDLGDISEEERKEGEVNGRTNMVVLGS